jgi:hypothetical protein
MSNLIFWQEGLPRLVWKTEGGNHARSAAPRLTGMADVVDCMGGHALVIHITLSLVRNGAPRAKPPPGTIDSLVEHDRKVQQFDS